MRKQIKELMDKTDRLYQQLEMAKQHEAELNQIIS